MAHVIDAIISLKDNFTTTLNRVSSSTNRFAKQQIAMSKQMKKTGKSVENFGSKLTKSVTAPLMALGTYSAKAGAEFGDSIAQVSTIADTNAVPIRKLSKDILKLSDDTGIASKEISSNVYDAISAGQKTGDAVNFVKNSTMLAKAGFANAGDSLDILTTIMNAYKMKAEDVTKVSDFLITTQNEGKVTVAELSASMGKVIPTAVATNTSLRQITAGYALMTKNGIKAAETTTYMNSMLNEMSKNGSVADKAIKAATKGKSFSQLMKEGKNLSDVLNILNDYAKKNNLSLKDMFGSAEAGKAALVMSTGAGKDFNEMLEKMDKSNGATKTAFDKMQTPAEKLRISLNKLRNMAIKYGSTLTPIIESITNEITYFGDKLKNVTPEQMQFITKVALMAATIGPLAMGIGRATVAISKSVNGISKFILKANKAGGVLKYLNNSGNRVVLLLTALSIAAILIYNNWDKINAIFDKVSKKISSFTGKNQGTIKKLLMGASAVIPTTLAVYKTFGGKFSTVFKLMFKASAGSAKGIVKIISFMARAGGKGFGLLLKIVTKASNIMISILGKSFGLLLNIVSKATGLIIGILGKFFAFLLANPIVLIIMLIIGAIFLFRHAWNKNWGDIQGKTKKCVDAIKKAIGGIKKTFTSVADKCKEFAENIKEKWGELKKFLKHPIKGTIDLVTEMKKKKGKKVGQNAMGTPFWGGGLTWVGERGAELIELPAGAKVHDHRKSMKMASPQVNIAKNISNNMNNVPKNSTKWGKDIPKNLADGIKGNIPTVASATKEMAQSIRELIHFTVPDKGPLADADTYGVDMVEILAKGINSNTKTATKATNNMAKQSKNVITNLQKQSRPMGSGICKMLANGINASANNVTSAVRKLTDKVINQFKQGFGIHSPSIVMFKIGKYLLEGFINGMGSQDVEGFIKKQIGDLTNLFADGAVSGNVTGWLTAALMATGTPLDWLAGLQRLVMAESSGNPFSVNSISVGGEHATGLLQTLPSTFKEFMQQGMGDILNPVHNTAAAINYIKSRYGSVYNTPLFRGGNYSGYATGTPFATAGYHWVGEEGPELIKFKGGEEVINNKKAMGRGDITIEKLADKIIVRDDTDIDKIAHAVVHKIKKEAFNTA